MPITKPPAVAAFRGVRAPATVVAPFAPSDLSGLIGWYKADTLGLSDAAAVATWPDSSSNAKDLTQGTAGARPTFHTAQQNGLGAVTFDPATTADWMSTSAYASPTAGCSVFAVVKIVDSALYRTLFNHAGAATWASPFSRALVRITDTGASKKYQFVVQDAGVGGNAIVSAAAATTATWQYIEFVYDATNQTMWRAGTQLGTQARSGALTSSTQPLFIGAATDGSVSWNGQVGEIVYYNRGVNATERGQVETYLAAKWAL